MPQRKEINGSFPAAAKRFELSVSAIRDYVESLATAATLPRDQGVAEFTEQVGDLLRRSVPETALNLPQMGDRPPGMPNKLNVKFLYGPVREQLDQDRYEVHGHIAIPRDARELLKHSDELEMIVLVPDGSESTMSEAARKIAQGDARARLLFGSALIALFTFFETLMSELVDKFYELNTSALASGGSSIDVKDVLQANSLENLIRDLIARRTDQTIRGGIDEWSKFFQREYSTNLSDLMGDSEWIILESAQRRHVLVHNNGVVDSTYLRKVEKYSAPIPRNAGARRAVVRRQTVPGAHDRRTTGLRAAID